MLFSHADSWLTKSGAMPLWLSQSFPLRKERFKRNECRGFFAGVLPEESKREIIPRNLGIRARNDYAMLAIRGNDMASDRPFTGIVLVFPEMQDHKILERSRNSTAPNCESFLFLNGVQATRSKVGQC